jgi:hypothetical protein
MTNEFANHGVQIQIKEDGSIVWVNVDGVCIARIVCASKLVEVEDNRPSECK